MGQNSDIHNIFESYSKKVLLKEQQLSREEILALKDQANRIKDPTKKQAILDEITKGSAAPSTVAKPVDVPGPQSNSGGISVGGLTLPATKPSAPNSGGTVTAQMPSTPTGSSGGGISVGGLTLPATKPSAPNSGGAVTAQMPTDPQGSSASNIDVEIPADLGGGGTAPNSEKTPLEVGGGISIGNPDAAQEAPAKTTGAGSNKKQSSSNNGSIVDYLAGKNQAFDKASRGELAAQYGIQNYTGTAQQNTDLLNKLRANEKMTQGTNATGEKQYAAGTVPKAPANEPQQQQPQQQQGMGGVIGGASKLAGGAGNLAKKALIGDQPLGGIVGGASKLAGGAGNLLKKALIGGGQQQPAAQQAAPVQQQATATTQPAAPVQQTVSTKKQTAPTKQAAPVQKTASNYKKTPGDASAFFKDQADEEIQENKNIAKFVKCLSEKNYSQAHEYLKKVVNSKVEKNLYRVINKI
jgi:hypothetical protein